MAKESTGDRFTLKNHESDLDSNATGYTENKLSLGSEGSTIEADPVGERIARHLDFSLGIGLEPDRSPRHIDPPTPEAPTELHDGERVEYAITVFAPVGEVYSFWRDFDNIPKIMTHVREIEVLNAGERVRWHWATLGGFEMQWDTVMIDDVPDKVLSWRTVPGSAAQHAGSVWFKPVLDGQATEVYLRFIYKVPGGKLTKTFAELFGEAPEQVVKEDLRRLRCLIETGVTPDTNSRSH